MEDYNSKILEARNLYNLDYLPEPEVFCNERTLAVDNNRKDLFKYQYLNFDKRFWVLVISYPNNEIEAKVFESFEDCKIYLENQISKGNYKDLIGGCIESEFIDNENHGPIARICKFIKGDLWKTNSLK